MSTIVACCVLAVLLTLGIVTWAWSLGIGLHLIRHKREPITQLVFLAVANLILEIVVIAALRFAYGFQDESARRLLPLLELIVPVVLTVLLLSRVFRLTLKWAFIAALPTYVAMLLLLPLLHFVVRPYIIESYAIASNAMAPNLLGPRVVGVCPECGSANFCSQRQQGRGLDLPEPMICANYHIHELATDHLPRASRDLILVSKYLRPQRWDIVTFSYPQDPSALYVMRLVGLPGETIEIVDGGIHVNGSPVELPAHLSGLKYASELPHFPGILWGSPDDPAVLGDDEYFVLGDFTLSSNDSRLWTDGAPGYAPYAVPEEYLSGVVTHIYWPPQRWQALR